MYGASRLLNFYDYRDSKKQRIARLGFWDPQVYFISCIRYLDHYNKQTSASQFHKKINILIYNYDYLHHYKY